jgi:hypothetical protein
VLSNGVKWGKEVFSTVKYVNLYFYRRYCTQAYQRWNIWSTTKLPNVFEI